MKHWLHGEHILGPRSKWARFTRHPNNYPPAGPGATGGGGGGGVSAPPSPGGDGGGGGGLALPPSAPPSSSLSGAYQPPQQQMESFGGRPDSQLPVSPALQGALDGTGPGYQQQAQQPYQQPGQGQPQWSAPGQPAPGQPGQQVQQGQQPGQPGQQPAGDPTWNAVAGALQRYGVNLPQGITPEQGLMGIAQALQGQQQRNYYADLGRSLAESGDWEQFNQWRQQGQGGQQQGQQPEQNELWNIPHFDRNWLSMVEEDQQTGRFRSKQGYDPRIGVQVQAYYDFLSNAQTEMWQDPQQFFWKHTEPMVQQAIQQGIQQHFGQYQEQVQAQSVLNANGSWLYAKDPMGRTMHAADGRPQLTPQGTMYFQHLQTATQMGLQGVHAQHQYAVGMLERDLLRQRVQQGFQPNMPGQQPGQPGMQAPQGRLQLNGPQQPQQPQGSLWSAYGPPAQQTPPGMGHYANVNGMGQIGGPAGNPLNDGGEQPMGGSLADAMRQQFAMNNITDQAIRDDMRQRSGQSGW